MSHEVWGQVYRAARRARADASHDARVRQHAAHGRARGAAPVRAPRRRPGDVAPRQHVEGAAPQAPSSGSRTASSRSWSRRRRSSSASTSATSTSCASSARRARSPTFLQRAGRASHQVGGVPKARLFPLSRDELVECAALLDAVPRGELDRLHDPAQAARRAVAADRRRSRRARVDRGRAVRRRSRCASPVSRRLTRSEFLEVVRTLSDGFSTQPRPARRLRASRCRQRRCCAVARGARLTALTSGGAIPDNADYDVVLEPAGSEGRHRQRGLRGREPRRRRLPARQHVVPHPCASKRDAFASRMRRARRRRFRSGSAKRRAGRDELSQSPCRGCARTSATARERAMLRERGDARRRRAASRRGQPARRVPAERARGARRAADAHDDRARALLRRVAAGCSSSSTRRSAAASTARGGSRCASASASSSTSSCRRRRPRMRSCCRCRRAHSFAACRRRPLPAFEHRARRAGPGDARGADVRRALAVDRQALARAAALSRRAARSPAPLQRMRAEDLMASVFPDQVACAENIDRRLARFPTTRSCDRPSHDCLHEAMDIDGLVAPAARHRVGRDRRRRARDARMPSPLALEVLTAQAVRLSRRRAARGAAHAGGDGAPLAGRRRRPRTSGGSTSRPSSACASEAWPAARPARRAARRVAGPWLPRRRWRSAVDTRLGRARRCARGHAARHWRRRRTGRGAAGSRPSGCRIASTSSTRLRRDSRAIDAPAGVRAARWSAKMRCRNRAEPTGGARPGHECASLASTLAVADARRRRRTARLAGEGVAMRGHFTPGAGRGVVRSRRCSRASIATRCVACARRSSRSRRRISCASCCAGSTSMPGERREGPDALDAVIAQLQGFEAPAAAWEVGDPAGTPGRLRLHVARRPVPVGSRGVDAPDDPTEAAASGNGGPIRTTPVALLPRRGRAAVGEGRAADRAARSP